MGWHWQLLMKHPWHSLRHHPPIKTHPLSLSFTLTQHALARGHSAIVLTSLFRYGVTGMFSVDTLTKPTQLIVNLKKNLQTQKWTSITASGCPTHEIGERESYRSYFSWILHNLLGSLYSLVWYDSLLNYSIIHNDYNQRDSVPPCDPHAALKIWAELWLMWKEPFLE